MSARRRAAFVAAAAAIVLALFVVGRGGEERAVRARLERVVAAARTRRLRAELDAVLADDLVVRAADAPQLGSTKAGLLAAAERLPGELGAASLEAVEVRLRDGDHEAMVDVVVLFSTPGQSEPVRRTRHLVLAMQRRDAGWTIGAIELLPAGHDQPEARP